MWCCAAFVGWVSCIRVLKELIVLVLLVLGRFCIVVVLHAFVFALVSVIWCIEWYYCVFVWFFIFRSAVVCWCWFLLDLGSCSSLSNSHSCLFPIVYPCVINIFIINSSCSVLVCVFICMVLCLCLFGGLFIFISCSQLLKNNNQNMCGNYVIMLRCPNSLLMHVIYGGPFFVVNAC